MKKLRNFNPWLYLHSLGMLFVFLTFFSACEDLLDTTEVELQADAGSDISVNVGEQVALDGSGSSVSEGDFSYQWAFAAIPASSNAQLTDASTANPVFTPDVSGEYWVELTISNGDKEDRDTVKVLASGSDVVTADAGEDLETTVNTTVNLDGSNSSAESGTLAYNWTFASMPDGSNASISGADAANASFTPDVQGEYVITLTVTNGSSTSTDQITITVTGSATKELSGTLESDRILKDHVDDENTPDYLVTGNYYVKAELTVNPNVLIHVKEDKGIWVDKEGSLVAEGTSDSLITITSDNAEAGLRWKGIFIASSSSLNNIAYTNIAYAGNSQFGDFADFVDVPVAIGLYNDGKLNLTNTTVTNSGGYGLYSRYGTLASYTDNSFSNNAEYDVGLAINQAHHVDENSTYENGVEIFGSSSSQDVTLAKLSGTTNYHVTGDITIQNAFEISAGAKLLFSEDVKMDVNKEGSIQINGTSSAPIHLTSKDSASDIRWKGIFIRSTSAKNSISHADISYAGNSQFGDFANFVDVPAAIGLTGDARLELSNTTLRQSGGYGMYLRYGVITGFSANTFANNAKAAIGLNATQASGLDASTAFSGNEWNGAEVFGSSISEELTWGVLQGAASYHVIGNITVSSGGLTINPGVTMEFDEDVKLDVGQDGYLSAEGTASEMITFTTSNVAGQIYWKGIRFSSANALNSLDYVHINYGGGAEHDLDNFEDIKTAVSGNENAQLSLTNSTVENSEGYGVYFQGTINDVESSSANNTFSNNPSGNYY